MKKSETIEAWQKLAPNQDPLAQMIPIQKMEGSRYGQCGIRIDGTPAFIDAVLSNLKALLDGENNVTRLELARNKVKRQDGYKAGQNAFHHSEVCYIRLHLRGEQGAMASGFFGKHLKGATERYEKTIKW